MSFRSAKAAVDNRSVASLRRKPLPGRLFSTNTCHSEEVAAATDEESAFALKNKKQIPLPRLRDRNDRPGGLSSPCLVISLGMVCAILALDAARAKGSGPSGPPPTRRDGVSEVLHGVTVPDPYRWLENQQSPDTRAWIEAENIYAQSVLGRFSAREQLKQRLAELMKIDTMGMPVERQGRYFFSKRLASQDLFVLYLRQGSAGQDEVLIDPHPLSADHTTSIALENVARDGRLLAYGVREGGQDEVTIRFLDVDLRRNPPDVLSKADYFSVSIEPDKSGVYYSRRTPDGCRVYHHAMGTDPAQDTELFGKGFGPGDIIGADLSEDGRFLLIEVLHGSAAEKTEVYFQDLARRGPITAIVNDIQARFFASFGGDKVYMQTNWKAPHGRILAVDLKDPSREHWREVVPERDAVIEGFSPSGGDLFVNYLENVVSHVEVFRPDGRHFKDLAFPALGSVSEVSGRWEGREAFFQFSSFHIPTTIYRYNVTQGTQGVWARLNVPIDSDKFELKQVWDESNDKTRVPMFLLHCKDIKLDGSNPTLLTGYGGFDIALTPSFSPAAVLWAEKGGVFAMANLRGGGEFGEEWHRAGMLAKKQNVFDDFIAAAEWLIKNGYTKPSKLSISGTSNGGLLVGAALTQRPDLFQAVVCRYPLLDMLRYQNFLVAKFWVPEYGSSENTEQFKYLYAYSPYQNVTKGTPYPAVMFVSGDGDTRVDPLHARKMAAMLQWATGSDRPVILEYDTKSGHSGGRPLAKQIDESGDELSFLLGQLGVH
jgi:prolyl oligopeptidase